MSTFPKKSQPGDTNTDVSNEIPVVTNRVFTLANVFSFSRALIAIPIIWSYEAFGGVNPLFTVLVAYGIISDYLDGWAARSNNEISELGKVLDPIADKIMAAALFVYATWLELIPIWFLVVTLGRDALILIGSVYISKRFGKVAMSVMSGKVFVNALAIYWLAVIYFPDKDSLHLFFLSGATVLLIYSFGDYVTRFFRILRGAEFS